MTEKTDSYPTFFRTVTKIGTPHKWQTDLGGEFKPSNRLIRVPTGFGKTAGAVLPWLWHRGKRNDTLWPRRLVYCLPMRTLVEQTTEEIRSWVARAGMLWDGCAETHNGKIGVHVLMGGCDTGDWHLYPEECDTGDWHLYPEENAILIGTQDMLISRALNRGYASPRARWPMEFGLLNHDALWIADEVQLMDVGLATTAQLQQFREEDTGSGFRPAYTWWMSATLQEGWLISVDTRNMVEEMLPNRIGIPPAERAGDLWNSTKQLTVSLETDPASVSRIALERHESLRDTGHGRITMVVLNRVDRAVAVYRELEKRGRSAVTMRLVHSRFRGVERRVWRQDFLSRVACSPGADLIVIATQVVEAGVDISAGCLIADLAPWPSLVQRFGRAARYGGHADVVVLDPGDIDDKNALPYEAPDLIAARAALQRLTDVSQKALEDFEAGLLADERQKLYPYDPRHLLLRKERDELFDTTPDLTGADLDISRFIRTGQERDCQVFWADWNGGEPPDRLQPHRDALCAVPFYGVHAWLFKGDNIKDDLKAQVFVWDYLDDAWRSPKKKDIYPGRLVLVRSSVGGYSVETGFTGEKPNNKTVPAVVAANPTSDAQADLGADNDRLSEAEQYQTIATHGAAVAAKVGALASALGLPADLTALFIVAGRYHDVGKVHRAFRCRIRASPEWKGVLDLAKAPNNTWTGARTCIRHELASALALMELLARTDQNHPALLGSCQELIAATVLIPENVPATVLPESLATELRDMTADQFNLLVYLVCAHHGKVRAALHASPADQNVTADEVGMPIRGIREGDILPPVRIMDAHGAVQLIPELDMHLSPAQLGLSGRYGPSWRERTLALEDQYGPFTLAWLETILRAADIRVSRQTPS